jgi:hypothetical protein
MASRSAGVPSSFPLRAESRLRSAYGGDWAGGRVSTRAAGYLARGGATKLPSSSSHVLCVELTRPLVQHTRGAHPRGQEPAHAAGAGRVRARQRARRGAHLPAREPPASPSQLPPGPLLVLR